MSNPRQVCENDKHHRDYRSRGTTVVVLNPCTSKVTTLPSGAPWSYLKDISVKQSNFKTYSSEVKAPYYEQTDVVDDNHRY